MNKQIKFLVVAFLAAVTVASCAHAADAKPRGEQVKAWHVVFATSHVKATPRAYTRTEGQVCSRRKLDQGTGRVTTCVTVKASRK